MWLSQDSLLLDALEVVAVRPDGPGDAGECVGEGDGSLVVAAGPFDLEGSGPQAIRGSGLRGVADEGAGAMN